MDPDGPPTSELHAALWGVLLSGAAAWGALVATLLDWLSDGRTLLGEVGRPGAVLLACALSGAAAALVAAMLGAIEDRRIRRSALAGLLTAEAAALVAAAGLLALGWLGVGLADVLVPASLAAAGLVAVAATAAVMLTPRHDAAPRRPDGGAGAAGRSG